MDFQVKWPDNKRFAFTVFDDTDLTTLKNGPVLYRYLQDLGIRTTKSVWPLRGDQIPVIGGATCEEPDYLNWVQHLQRLDYEIALHCVAYHTSTRDQVRQGIDRFRELFGHFPKAHANHEGCFEGIYWGDARLSGWHRWAYLGLHRFKRAGAFKGHVPDSNLFWGDICQEHVDYVRNFVFLDINTLRAAPYMPYYDPGRPYVKSWFASSEAPNLDAFNKLLAEKNQDRLEAEGGACIVYTHFGKGFVENGRVNSRFKHLMNRLSRKNGWFVPVSTLLDYLRDQHGGVHTLTNRERARLQTRWMVDKLKLGGTS
ncbi:MAG: hypothetical protein WDZ76_09445 [Pseudohongiellaceae bacterium]